MDGQQIKTMKKSSTLNTEQKFISRRSLAARWESSIMTIRRFEKAGKLKAYFFGRDARYALENVEQLEREALAA